MIIHMPSQSRASIAALTAAGILWGFTVPLSKLGLAWLGPAWLTFGRFAVAAGLLGFAARRRLRGAFTPAIVVAGAVGFGAVVMLQNAGIEHTSVSHAGLLVGVVPVLVALFAVGTSRSVIRPLAWAGYALALGGIALVAGNGGGGASTGGDVLVLSSAVLSAGFVSVQPRLLAGRDPGAVTGVQFAAAAIVALATALVTKAPATPVLQPAFLGVLAALSLAGTLAPFWLFAYGQARLPAPVAGAFVNLEPVVGVAAGWLAFGDPIRAAQVVGGLAVVAGIVLSTPLAGRTSRPWLWH
jgi:O-acetylserine/cysteine efflux transporter